MEESQQAEKDINSSKVPVQWADCICLAIISSQTQLLEFGHIINYVIKFFPEKIDKKTDWKNTIRQTIDKNPRVFRKVKVEGQRTTLHSISQEHIEKIEAERKKGLCLLSAVYRARRDKDINISERAMLNPSRPYYLRSNLQCITLDDSVYNEPLESIIDHQYSAPQGSSKVIDNDPRGNCGGKVLTQRPHTNPKYQRAMPTHDNPSMQSFQTQRQEPQKMLPPRNYDGTTRFAPASQICMTSTAPNTNYTVKGNQPIERVLTTPMVRQSSRVQSGHHSTIIQPEKGVFSDDQTAKRHVTVHDMNKGLPVTQSLPSQLASSTDFTLHNQMPQTFSSVSHPTHQPRFPVRQIHPNKFETYQKSSNVLPSTSNPQSNQAIRAILSRPTPSLGSHLPTSSMPLDLTKESKSFAVAPGIAIKSGEGETRRVPIPPRTQPFIPRQSLPFTPTPYQIQMLLNSPALLQPPLIPPTVNPIPSIPVSSFLPPQSVIQRAPSTSNPTLPPQSVYPTSLPSSSSTRMKSTSGKLPRAKIVKNIWTNPQKNTQNTREMNDRHGIIEGRGTKSAITDVHSGIPSSSSSSGVIMDNPSDTTLNPVDMTVRKERKENTMNPIPTPSPIATVHATVPPSSSSVPSIVRIESEDQRDPTTTPSSITIVQPTVPPSSSQIRVKPGDQMETPSTSSIPIISSTSLHTPTEIPTERKEMERVELEEEDSRDNDEEPLEINTSMNDIEQDISSMNIRKEAVNPSIIPKVMTSVQSIQRKDNQKREGGSVGFKQAAPSLLPSQQSLPIPSVSIPSSIDSIPLSSSIPPSIDLSKFDYTRAQHTALPKPQPKRKGAEPIGLIIPKVAIRPVIRPANKQIIVKTNQPLMKTASILRATKELKSQVALSLKEREKEDELGGKEKEEKEEAVSRRKAEKERNSAKPIHDGSAPLLEREDGYEEVRRSDWNEGGRRRNGEIEEEVDGIIFEGTSKKKRSRFYCNSLQFEDEIGFAADSTEKSDKNGRIIDTDDEFDEDNSPWGDSVVGYTIKRTEKEREADRHIEDTRTKKQRLADRRKEIEKYKMEGRKAPPLENDKRKKQERDFDPKLDRFIESNYDSEKRRERSPFKEYLVKKPLHAFQRYAPFYLRSSITGFERGTSHKREHQRIHFTKINPNLNLPYILSGGHNRTMFLHSYLSGKPVETFRPHFTYPNDASWSYCGHFIIATGTDKLVAIMEPGVSSNVRSRLYAEDIPIAARFTQNMNLSVVAMKSGIMTIMDWRIDTKSAIIRRIAGMPEITCMDTNPQNWAKTVFGCENGLVTEFDFFEDHRKSTTDSYFQYFLKGMRNPIFSCLPYEEYDDNWDESAIKSIRYCSSEYSSCIDDIVITKGSRNDSRRDSAYKFSPGRAKPVVTYSPPDGLNLSCASFAYNHNSAHQKKYNSCENYIVAGTEEGTVMAFNAETGELLKGGTAVVDDITQLGNNEMRYLKDMDPMATVASYVPIRKYFSHEKTSVIDPELPTRLTAIDAVPDPHMRTFVVGGWGVNPVINIYKFQDDSDIEHLLDF